MLFPAAGLAGLTLAFHAERAWLHRAAVSAALERDGNICADCGVSVPGMMEIHCIDDDHGNWSEDNLTPICHFCHLARHPAQAGLSSAEREHPLALIWWPGLSQPAVCAMAWAAAWLRAAAAEQRDQGDSEEAPGLDSLNGRLDSQLRRRRGAALHAAGDCQPAALLNVARREGGELPAWKDLRWWPRAADGPGGGLLFWRAGSGFETIIAAEAARAMLPPLRSGADECLERAAARLRRLWKEVSRC